MNLKDLAKTKDLKNEDDAWWLCLGTQLLPEVFTATEVEVFVGEHPNSNIAVLHVSEAGQSKEDWIYLSRSDGDTSDSGAGLVDSLSLMHQLTQAKVQIVTLEERLAKVESTLLILEKPVREAMRLVEEQARYVYQSEEELIAKLNEHERVEAELEQLRENLHFEKAQMEQAV